jgi:hypothetical protein
VKRKVERKTPSYAYVDLQVVDTKGLRCNGGRSYLYFEVAEELSNDLQNMFLSAPAFATCA